MGKDAKSGNPMSIDVKMIQGLKHFYGKESVELMNYYVDLDTIGQKKLLQYASDMTLIHGKE